MPAKSSNLRRHSEAICRVGKQDFSRKDNLLDTFSSRQPYNQNGASSDNSKSKPQIVAKLSVWKCFGSFNARSDAREVDYQTLGRAIAHDTMARGSGDGGVFREGTRRALNQEDIKAIAQPPCFRDNSSVTSKATENSARNRRK
jgi:hypothetical protein